MLFDEEELARCDVLEKKIKIICNFNNAKCSFRQGRILKFKNTNINFIEPHKIDISICDKKIILIYFNADNLFLYNRTMPIDTKQVDKLLKLIRNK